MTSEIRLALLSDVHADVIALREALAQADRLGCTRVLCAGDLVGEGPFPEETIELLQARQVLCVAGNHDLWAIGRGQAHSWHEAELDAEPWDACGWELSEEALAFLAGLSRIERLEVGGIRVAMCHGSPRSVMEGVDPTASDASLLGRYLSEARADVLHVGHIHTAFELTLPGGALVMNPGALGREGEDPGAQPWPHAHECNLDGSTLPSVRGTFGVLDLPARRFSVYRAHDGHEVEILRRALGAKDWR